MPAPDMPAPAPVIRPQTRAARNTRDPSAFSRPGQAQKYLKLATEHSVPVHLQREKDKPIEPLSNMEMFHKSNFSLVEMMKIKKDQIK